MKKALIFLVPVLIVCVIAIYPPPLLLRTDSVRHAKVHISIDDVDSCIGDFVKNKAEYKSIFEQPFLAYLQQLHNDYGVKVTLYMYAETDNWTIEEIPEKYRDEFEANSDWLRLGFHAIRPVFSKKETSIDSVFQKAFQRTTDGIARFAGNRTLSNILRLHYFFATEKERQILAENGVKTLLTADNPDRESYSLYSHGRKSWSDSAIHYLATDFRIENMSLPVFKALKDHVERDTLAIFTHEWALNDNWNKIKFERVLRILSANEVSFIN